MCGFFCSNVNYCGSQAKNVNKLEVLTWGFLGTTECPEVSQACFRMPLPQISKHKRVPV